MAKSISTIAAVEAAKSINGRRTEYPDVKVRGLALRVTPAGEKSWSLRYRNREGKQQRMSLGVFPVVSLSKAREEATKVLGAVADGQDPAAAKQASRAAAKSRRLNIFADLIEGYLADAARGGHRPNARPKRESTIALDRYYFERHIKPALGSTAIDELKRSDVQRFLDDVGAEAPSTARHCRAVIRQAYNYAVRRELTKNNPAAFTSLPAPSQRDRVLTFAELRAIWAASEGDGLASLAIRLAMLTLQRGGEVVGIHADEIDRVGRTWTIPGVRTKNHRTHVVPLSDAALAILEKAFARNAVESEDDGPAWSGYAFPARRGAKGAAMARPALSRALKRIANANKIANATPHDFRRTGSTNITGERIGLPRFIVSRILNQMSDTGGAASVTGVYDRNEYLSDKRRALDLWASLLMEIVEEEER